MATAAGGGGEVVFATVGPLRDIADAIVTGAAAVLDEYGEDEYQRRWVQYPFPAEMLTMVRGLLGA
jgi:hypothetical protein